MLNLQYSLLVAPSLFILVSSVHSSLDGLAFARCMWVKHPDIKNVH